jgi:AAA domain
MIKIEKLTNTTAPIVLIFGGEGESKTTLASKFPKSIWMPLERGLLAGVELDAIDGLLSYADIVEALRELCKDPQGYQTLVVDTLGSLQPLLLDHVCAAHNWKNIESPSYGNVAADNAWQGFIKGITSLRDKHGITIVLVAHAAVERFDDPRAPTYTMYLPKLHKRARALVCDAADVIGFPAEELRVATDDGGLRERVRASSSNQRFLFVEGTPAYVAKNRYGMPPKIPVPADFDISELTKFWSQPKEGKGE